MYDLVAKVHVDGIVHLTRVTHHMSLSDARAARNSQIDDKPSYLSGNTHIVPCARGVTMTYDIIRTDDLASISYMRVQVVRRDQLPTDCRRSSSVAYGLSSPRNLRAYMHGVKLLYAAVGLDWRNVIVGVAGDASLCPVATYLRGMGDVAPSVCDDTITTSRGDYRMPPWLRRFVRVMDGDHQYGDYITLLDCVETLA